MREIAFKLPYARSFMPLNLLAFLYEFLFFNASKQGKFSERPKRRNLKLMQFARSQLWKERARGRKTVDYTSALSAGFPISSIS
ncbi:MAG: hypothetical protein AAFR60_11785, partial [Pseudomonadota bacterium]